jgi:hypothetical protein
MADVVLPILHFTVFLGLLLTSNVLQQRQDDSICSSSPKEANFKTMFKLIEPIYVDFTRSQGSKHLLKRVFSAGKISYQYPNSCSTFNILLKAGDIETNPGDVKNPCSGCSRPVAKTHMQIRVLFVM